MPQPPPGTVACSPLTHPPTSFLSLPRELRDKIYTLAVTTNEPIVTSVSSMYLRLASLTRRNLALNILRCNRQLASEAAPVFYSLNSFEFVANRKWKPVISWLESIGERNRQYLRKVVFQLPDSMHIPDEIFELLAREDEGRQLMLSLRLPFWCVPGVEPKTDEQNRPWIIAGRRASSVGMDLPNLVESLKTIHAPGMEVRWWGEAPRAVFERQRVDFKEAGWEILEQEDAAKGIQSDGRGAERVPTKRFTLKLNPLRRKEEVVLPVPEPPHLHPWHSFVAWMGFGIGKGRDSISR